MKFENNRAKYKGPGNKPDIQIAIYAKRPGKMINIKANDPLVRTPYNKLYLSDQVEKKKFMTETDMCRT